MEEQKAQHILFSPILSSMFYIKYQRQLLKNFIPKVMKESYLDILKLLRLL